ncbi:MAG: phosphatase PAP2 family protein [Candidatus Lindowbacteria bacterium]|nr:phosphatase PAP2 family protein [Candidatus Lindowbacteria bacterium]
MIQRKYNLNLCIAIMLGAVLVALALGALQKQFGIFDSADALAISITKSVRSVVLTPPMWAISWIGDEMGLMIVICVVYWLGYTVETIFFLLVLLFGNVINTRMKEFFELQRPLSSEISRLYETDGYGYPSGHTQTGVLYSWLIYAFVQKYWPVCLLAAFLMAASRIYVGDHYFSDTVGGFICGLGLVIGATGIYGHMRDLNSLRQSLRRSPALRVLLSLALSGVYLAFAWPAPDASKYSGFLLGFFVVYSALDFRWRWRSLPLAILASVVGLAVLLGVRLGLSAILPKTDISNYCRYFFLGYLLAISPLAFVKIGLLKKKED